MKKISFFLAAALLVGIGSAFTTSKPAAFAQAYGLQNGQWYSVNTDDINITFRCDTGAEYCLYDSENGSPLPGQTQDKQFVKLP